MVGLPQPAFTLDNPAPDITGAEALIVAHAARPGREQGVLPRIDSSAGTPEIPMA